ncbi:monovalent cation/H(+) antiporter subunit G [Pseudohalocynthiibacter aestuariivivens]|uniref:Monovalent cation/H(+) antiporter subunit G n=1 Tax=Roseovarius pelagicus TaxID=2980108 RepID=A0ABY6DDU7_9RHOB|nr:MULTISPECIES: monovalent cation/H(+) antiporter subunit G [Rhodobacterales]QIE47140.1 monovalent cation/H(+) antiporter subunit G [Pseudohalocynthiibacter aestuariivivens]UXX84306.1 monovalent cation/H(+) antiporter subunit G [Roseovarius pelagicus]
MTIETLAMFAIGICLLIGAFFMLVGVIGLLRFNDSMTRLHAPTKVGTMGVGALLLASIINAYVTDHGSAHQILIMAFLFVTAPISANFLGKVNIHRGSCETPPKPPQDETWATFDVPEADREIAVQQDA